MREVRAPRFASAGFNVFEAVRRCRTPGRPADRESLGRFPIPDLSMERASFRQYAATSARSEGNVLILLPRRSLPTV